jgi:hypothetical protein
MNTGTYLRIGLLLALAITAQEPLVWAQGSSDVGASQIDWPDTPAGRWGEAFFEAFNAEGDDALRQFIKGYYSEAYLKEHPLENELATFRQARMILVGGARAVAVEGDGDFVVVVTVESSVLGRIGLRIELSSSPPHDLVNMNPVRARVPPNVERAEYTDWTELHDLVEEIRRDAGIPALAVAIVHGGRTVEKAVAGVRRFDRPDQVQIDDRFHLESVSKSWTADLRSSSRYSDEGRVPQRDNPPAPKAPWRHPRPPALR